LVKSPRKKTRRSLLSLFIDITLFTEKMRFAKFALREKRKKQKQREEIPFEV
jgi:hypothetical protein